MTKKEFEKLKRNDIVRVERLPTRSEIVDRGYIWTDEMNKFPGKFFVITDPKALGHSVRVFELKDINTSHRICKETRWIMPYEVLSRVSITKEI